MWSDARCKEAKQRCSMLAVRSETNLWPLVPTASPGVQVKSTKAERTTKQHVNVTSSRKPKSTLSAGAHTHIRTHNGMTQTFVGPPRGRGREEGHIHVACSLAWCHALCCIQWLQLAAAAAVFAACVPPTLACVPCYTLVLWMTASWCCLHCSCLVAGAGAGAGGSGRCCVGAHSPL